MNDAINWLQDMHCHLDLMDDFENQIKTREQACIRTLSMTTTPRAWSKNKSLMRGCRYVRPALGLHPEVVAQGEGLGPWEKVFEEADYIGEVGIDGRRHNRRAIDRQKEVFEFVLKSSFLKDKRIISIHSSGAVRIVLDLIEIYKGSSKTKPILHWFSGRSNELRQAVDLGCYFSVNYSMLRTKQWMSLGREIPLEKLLIETDAPFIKVPKCSGDKDLIYQTANLLAEYLGVELVNLGRTLNQNFERLFLGRA